MRISIFLILLIVQWAGHAQETPPIIQYSASDYNGENQNWDIAQDLNKFIYVANNEGLLEFNGDKWRLYESPNQSIPRSVMALDNRLYMGFYMEFGYYERDEFGKLVYTSLVKKLELDLSEDEIIWHIKVFKGYIFFQSYDRIYIYNPTDESLSIKSDKNNIYRIFSTKENLFVYKRDGTIVSIEDGYEKQIVKIPDELNIEFVLELYDTPSGLIFLTRNKGLFKVQDGRVTSLGILDRLKNAKLKIFCGLLLRDGSWVIGTISSGIFHIGSDGTILNNINVTNGLSNNTVLNLYEDSVGNVWVALDNGIDCINMNSYITEYNDFDGFIGTVYAAELFKDHLYIGTNQGLFYRLADSKDKLKLVKGSEGQIWSLFSYKDELLCGHTDGTLIIEDGMARSIGSIYGTWNFRIVPNAMDELLLGHYSGMSILKKVNNRWIEKGLIPGFQNSARFFEILEDNTVYVNHDNKGVFRLNFDYNNYVFTDVSMIENIEKSKGSGLLKVEDNIYYKNNKGVYIVDDQSVTNDSILTAMTDTKDYISGKIVLDKNGRIWGFNKSSLVYAENAPVTGEFVINRLPIDNEKKKATVSFENITMIDDNQYLLGKTNGYLRMDINKITSEAPTIFLNEVKVTPTDASSYKIHINSVPELKHTDNSLSFSYSTPLYSKYNDIQFQYQLKGKDNDWGSWNKSGTAHYEKLPYGTYEFLVRSKSGESISKNVENFEFTILPPFYLSNLALIIYASFFLLIMFVTHRSYKTYYKKKHELQLAENKKQMEFQRVKSEQELIELRNEKLNQQIEAKNREVAISMMSVVKRNEVLKSIKKELKKNTAIKPNDPVFDLIKKNTNSAEDWEFFQTAFDQADTDFLKRAKEKHPKLTANDLKFCAYLRLNLSSKDIAPLLNISVKSVEVRRYRLRKKLEISHETHLIDYILAI